MLLKKFNFMCSNLRCAYIKKEKTFTIKGSRQLIPVLKSLTKGGVIAGFSNMSINFSLFRVYLNYSQLNTSGINSIKIFSKPGRLIYVNKSTLIKYFKRYPNSYFVVSTNLGVFCQKKEFSKINFKGGLLLCKIN